MGEGFPWGWRYLGSRSAIMWGMASTVCGYCKNRAHMTPRWGHSLEILDTSQWVGEGAFTCDHCGRASLGIVAMHSGADLSAEGVDHRMGRSNAVAAWLPATGAVREFDDVPEPIRSSASEAFACASIGSNRAAILMARTVIEATAKDKGVTSGRLIAKIDALRDANLIRPDVAEAAHEIRLMGNDMAHGDHLDAVDATEADEILELMADVLEEVFQAPARLAARRARRQQATQQ